MGGVLGALAGPGRPGGISAAVLGDLQAWSGSGSEALRFQRQRMWALFSWPRGSTRVLIARNQGQVSPECEDHSLAVQPSM